MTNHQLKAHCEDVIANPQDHSEMVLAMAKALLPCLQAEPAGYFTYHEDEDRDTTDFIVESDSFAKNSFKLYRSPPVPELKINRIQKLAAEIVENLVDCSGADEAAVDQYTAWVIQRLNGVKS